MIDFEFYYEEVPLDKKRMLPVKRSIGSGHHRSAFYYNLTDKSTRPFFALAVRQYQ